MDPFIFFLNQIEYVPTGVDWQFTVVNRNIEEAKNANDNVFKILGGSIDLVILISTNNYKKIFHDYLKSKSNIQTEKLKMALIRILGDH